MTNIYRKIFYSIVMGACFCLFITSILLGVLLDNKIPSIVVGFLTIYLINAGLALWISTSNVRMVYTKLAWLLSFFVFPIISTLIYFIWGRMPYYKKGISNYKDEYKKYLDFYDSPYSNKANVDAFDLIAKYAYSTRKTDVFYNCDIEVVQNNNDFFEQSLKLIDSAKKTILMNYYIIDKGQFFSAVKEKIIKKAEEGIQIYLLFDRYGCKDKFTPRMVAELAKYKNINIAKFESDRDVWTRSANNFRSHKKMLVIDDEIALYGGSNLADEYIGIKQNSPSWSDLNFIIKGQIIKSFMIDFCIDWDFSGFLPYTWKMGDYLHCHKSLKPLCWIRFHLFPHWIKQVYEPAIKTRVKNKKLIDILANLNYFKSEKNTQLNNDNKAIFLQTGPRYYNNIVSDVLVTAILNAKKSVKIISPYLQLNDSLVSALVSASHRQIDIKIITPGCCDDKWFLLEMNRLNYPQLLDAQINLYEYKGFIHSKLLIVDDEYIVTGTYNLDFRSFNSNFESLLVIKNNNLVEQTLKYWNSTLKNTNEFSKFKYFETRNFKSVFIQSGLQIIQPLL